jgi:hypothetical protein
MKFHDTAHLMRHVGGMERRISDLEHDRDRLIMETEERGEIIREMRAELEEIRRSGTLGPKKPDPRVKPGRRPPLMRAAGVGRDPE